MSTDKYRKHQTSKYKRYVITRPDGTQFQGDTQAEVRKMNSDYEAKQESSNNKVVVKPQYDPDTGERIN